MPATIPTGCWLVWSGRRQHSGRRRNKQEACLLAGGNAWHAMHAAAHRAAGSGLHRQWPCRPGRLQHLLLRRRADRPLSTTPASSWALPQGHSGHFHCGCSFAFFEVMPTHLPSNQRSQPSHWIQNSPDLRREGGRVCGGRQGPRRSVGQMKATQNTSNDGPKVGAPGWAGASRRVGTRAPCDVPDSRGLGGITAPRSPGAELPW